MTGPEAVKHLTELFCLPHGRLFFFEPGTSIPKTSYSDADLTIPNTHPVILDDEGCTDEIFIDGECVIHFEDRWEIPMHTCDPATISHEERISK